MANVVPFERRNSLRQSATQRPQLAAMPTLPVREAIVDAWLDHQAIPAIAARMRVRVDTVQLVIRCWCEIWQRQSAASRLEAPAWLRERHNEIAAEVWAEAQERPAA